MSEALTGGIDHTPEVSDDKNQLEYVSKSRIKTFLQCPRKFYWKYWCEERGPGTIYTERGSQVHEAYELFHENAIDYIEEHDEMPERFTPLLPERQLWHQWVEYIGEFFRFELRRYNKAELNVMKTDCFGPGNTPLDIPAETLNLWEPIGVEAEFWQGREDGDWSGHEHVGTPDYVGTDIPYGSLPWLGSADLVAHTASVPGVDGTGAVIIDYKTGSVPDSRYRDEGIFLEGEYYGWLAESLDEFDYEVDAVAGYYPREDELIVSTYPNEDRRAEIRMAIDGMSQVAAIENFDTDESPLCHYNNSNNHGQCHFYPICPVDRGCEDCDGGQNDNHGSRYGS